MMTAKVYILHFSDRFYHCKHYIGITNMTPEDRLQKHREGGGAKLTAAVAKAGIQMSLHVLEEYETMREARDREKALKRHKGSAKFCPICKQAGTTAPATSGGAFVAPASC